MNETASGILSAIGSTCSIIGLAVTFVVLRRVGNIHRSFLTQARLPQLMEKISGHRSELSRLLTQTDFDEVRQQIESEIRKCHSNLSNLEAKLAKNHKLGIQSLLAKTESMTRRTTGPNKEMVREVYLGLIGLEAELDNLREDMKWRSRE